MTPTTKALVALTGAYTLSQFFRSYIAVIAPELSRDLGLGPSGFGWLSSVFFLSFAVAQIPVGIAFDRYGVGRPSMILMILGIFSALLFAAAPHPTFSMIAQSGLGFACAPLYMGLIYYAARHLHDHRYVQVISMVGAVGSVGALLAATPLGWATEVIGWRISVGLSAILALIAALSLYRWVDDRPVTPPPRQPMRHVLSGKARAAINLICLPLQPDDAALSIQSWNAQLFHVKHARPRGQAGYFFFRGFALHGEPDTVISQGIS